MDKTGKSYDERIRACEADIVTMLRNVGGVALLADVLGVYHLHYSAMSTKRGRYRYMRPDAATAFLARMERDGALSCTYNADGIVIEVRLQDGHGS